MTTNLLQPEVLARAEALGLAARQVVEGLRVGDHKSPFRGFSVEFVQHREYVPGDDIRHIDWKSYARSERYTIKQYQQETNYIAHLLVDGSNSMRYGERSQNKFAYAKLLAASLTFTVVKQRDSASLRIFDSEWRAELPASSQMGHVNEVCAALEEAEAADKTGLGPLLEGLADGISRRGIIALISDGFDEVEPILKGLRHLRFRGHEVILFHILHRDEVEFPLDGNVRFVDLEGSEELLTRPHLLRPAYLKAVNGYLKEMERGCESGRIDYVRMITDRPLSAALGEYLIRRRQMARREFVGFYAPWLLLGSLAVSVPLILHFFYRARYRKLPWGAMPFLRTAIEQTSRRLRFQEWILLALRCLLLLLLAFALARPTLRGTSGGRGDAVDAVFVFDTSYSLGARDGDGSRLDRAKDAALAVIDNLPPNSTVQVIASADRATHLGPMSPGNLDEARRTVGSVELTSLATDYLPGLTEALQSLDRGAGMNKEVYLFSDLSKSGFERQSAALKAKAEEIKARATLLLVRCGRETPANAAIVDITHAGGIPHKGARMPFTVMLRNTGSKPVVNASVTLEIDGRTTEKETAAVPVIAPGQTTPVTLTALLDDPGVRVVTARLSSDDVPGDNRLDRVIAVRDRINVLIVDGAPDRGDPKDSASHFIRNALLPVSVQQVDDYFVRTTVVTADEAGPGLLAGCDLVVLANVPASNADKPGVPGLSEEFAVRLAEFVRQGGGLVIGSGDHVLPERYNAVLGLTGVNLLPFELEDLASAVGDRSFKLAPETFEAGSFLARFREEPFRTVTADVDITKLVNLRTQDAPASRILLRTTDGKTVLAMKAVGEGEVLFAATSLDTKWGNWPAKAGSFVPLMQLTLAHLTGKSVRGANRMAGEPIAWTPSEVAKGFDLVRPDGRRVRLGLPTGGGGKRLAVNAPDVPLAGVYRIVSDDDAVRSPPFAVRPDLRESDNLEAMADGEIETLLGFKPVFLQAGTGAEAEIAGERSRREWTIWVLILLFVVAVGEAVFAWMCGKAW